MSEKNNIDLKILENANDDMLSAMSSKYSPLDDEAANRIFAKSKRKYKTRKYGRDFSTADEVTGVDVYMKPKWYKPVKAAVICLIALGGIGIGAAFIKNFRSKNIITEAPDPSVVSVENTSGTDEGLHGGSYKLTDYKTITEFDSLSRLIQLDDNRYMGIGVLLNEQKEYIYSISSDFSDIKRKELSLPDEVAAADDNIGAYSITPGGDIAVLYSIFDDNGVKMPVGSDESFDYSSFYENRRTSYGICFYNKDGSVKSFSLLNNFEECVEDPDNFYVSSFAQVSDDYAVIADAYGELMLCNRDGSLERISSPVDSSSGIISYMVFAPDGTPYLACRYNPNSDYSKTMLEVFSFDPEKKIFGTSVISINISGQSDFSMIMNGFGDYIMLYSDTSYLYGIKADSTKEMLLNWYDADAQPMQVVSAGNGEFYGYGGNYYENKSCIVYKLVRRNAEEAADIKTMNVGIISNNFSAEKIFNEFNKSQDKYRVNVINYYDLYVEQNGGSIEQPKNANESYDQHNKMEKLLQLDIVSGKAPDMIISSSRDTIELLGSKGFFADLYSFMDNDPDINRQTIAPNVLKALESKDGKLYSVAPSFGLSTIGIKSKYLNHENWTIREMMDIYDKADAIHKYDGLSKIEMLRILLEGQTDLVDIENAQCHFDSPDFIDMLKFCDRFVMEVDKPDKFSDGEAAIQTYYTNKAYWIPNDEDLASLIHFETDNQISWEKSATFGGEDFTFAGYPTSNGKGGKLDIYTRFAISETSKVKEGAWELLKTFFDYSKSSNYYVYGLPALKTELEKRLDKEMNLTDLNNGEVVESKKTKLGTVQYALTQNERDDLERYVLSCDTLANQLDYDAQSICYEEADAFFNGEKTAEEAANMMQVRISLLVSEKN